MTERIYNKGELVEVIEHDSDQLLADMGALLERAAYAPAWPECVRIQKTLYTSLMHRGLAVSWHTSDGHIIFFSRLADGALVCVHWKIVNGALERLEVISAGPDETPARERKPASFQRRHMRALNGARRNLGH